MNAATSVSVKKITLNNHDGHNLRETTSTCFSVARQLTESETDAGNFSVSYISAFSVARQSAKSETDTLIFGSVKFGSVIVFFSDADADRSVREKNRAFRKYFFLICRQYVSTHFQMISISKRLRNRKRTLTEFYST